METVVAVAGAVRLAAALLEAGLMAAVLYAVVWVATSRAVHDGVRYALVAVMRLFH